LRAGQFLRLEQLRLDRLIREDRRVLQDLGLDELTRRRLIAGPIRSVSSAEFWPSRMKFEFEREIRARGVLVDHHVVDPSTAPSWVCPQDPEFAASGPASVLAWKMSAVSLTTHVAERRSLMYDDE
jgi:hypothetical protein